jgi:hypothetical protein
MPSQSRKRRGLRTQKVVAEYLATTGWPFAESTGSGRSGSDITGTPGLCFEVKARADFNPMAWLRQAEMNTGLPMVTFRPNGMGETRIGEWPCILRLADLVELLRAAGYGDSVLESEIPEVAS